MFAVYYNNKKKWFEFKSNKQNFEEALYGLTVGVEFHMTEDEVYYLRFHEVNLKTITFLKGTFFYGIPNGVLLIATDQRGERICFEINGIKESPAFRLKRRHYKKVRDFLTSIMGAKGIEIEEMP